MMNQQHFSSSCSSLPNQTTPLQRFEELRIAHSTSSSLSRRSSEASRLVGCFQELNDRLSAFERLAQLKQMVVEGKLRQDVFEEMYRINTEKLVNRRRRKSTRYEVSNISVLDDFCVKHRSQHTSSSLLDMTQSPQLKIKRGYLYFDRIVLRSSSTFGTTKETIPIGTQSMTLMFYDKEPARVDLSFDKRQDQFVFDSEIEMLMFVEALEKALETAARSVSSKDEPVLLGRPNRSHSQISKDYDARKSACLTLEMAIDASASPLSPLTAKSFPSAEGTSTAFTAQGEEEEEIDDDDDDGDGDENNNDDEQDVEEKEDESEFKEVSTSTTAKTVLGNHTGLFVNVIEETIQSSSSPLPSPLGNDEKERQHIESLLQDTRQERKEAEATLELKKSLALKARTTETEVQAILKDLKAAEDKAIELAVESRQEDVLAAKNLADCVADEIAALNALDPDDIASTATTARGGNGDEHEFPMSNDLRILIGRPTLAKPTEQPMSPHAKLQYNLQQARKALVSARSKVEKSSERRRVLEQARREARKAVSTQMANCASATREVTHAEGSVLHAKATLTRLDSRIAHFEHCLLILDCHRNGSNKHLSTLSPRVVIAKAISTKLLNQVTADDQQQQQVAVFLESEIIT